jgi:hypothetical protein
MILPSSLITLVSKLEIYDEDATWKMQQNSIAILFVQDGTNHWISTTG